MPRPPQSRFPVPPEPWAGPFYAGPALEELEAVLGNRTRARMIYEALRLAPPEIAGIGVLIVQLLLKPSNNGEL